MRQNVLASPRIDIGTEAVRVDRGRIPEEGNDCRRGHKSVAPQGGELAHRHTMASDDERLSLIEPAHDLAAFVAELALGDGFSHVSAVAHRATVVDPARPGKGVERRRFLQRLLALSGALLCHGSPGRILLPLDLCKAEVHHSLT